MSQDLSELYTRPTQNPEFSKNIFGLDVYNEIEYGSKIRVRNNSSKAIGPKCIFNEYECS